MLYGFLQNLSIKTKLVALVLTISMLVSIFATFVFFVYDKNEFYQRSRRSANLLAEVIGGSSIGSIIFFDPSGANEYLSYLKADENIQQAYLFNDDSCALVGQYKKNDRIKSQFDMSVCKQDTLLITDSALILIRPVMLEQTRIGTIYIQSDLKEYIERRSRFINVFVLIILSSLTIALLLSLQLQKIISQPITKLLSVIKEVTHTKDFSIRVTKQGDDEVGKLAEGFNDMLAQIMIQNQALKSSKEQAEQLVKVKDRFLSKMNSDIQHPLQRITQNADSLEHSRKLDSDSRQKAHEIKIASENLHVIINDILDFSRIEAGRIEFDAVEFSIIPHIENLLKNFLPQARSKGLELLFETADNIPSTLIGDALRISQVLMNLVDNAIRFTHKGTIKVILTKASETHNMVSLKISVSDTGIGISPSHLESIFEDISLRVVEKGSHQRSGFGLFIAKQLVELQGGRMLVDSEVGKGSTFTFSIPLRKSDRGIQPSIIVNSDKPSELLASNTRQIILLIDGDHVSRFFASTVLKKNNFVVEVAETAETAGDKIISKDIALILLNISTDEIEHKRVLSNIREKIRFKNKNIPIIALIESLEQEVVKLNGLTATINKPFNPIELIHLIKKHIKSCQLEQNI